METILILSAYRMNLNIRPSLNPFYIMETILITVKILSEETFVDYGLNPFYIMETILIRRAGNRKTKPIFGTS